MLMAGKSTASQARWVTSLTTPNAGCASTSKGGKIEQSGEWHFEYDKDGQLTEKYKGSGKWWDMKRERWRYEWN